MPSRGGRGWRVAGWIAVAVVALVYIGLPVSMAVVAAWPARAPVGAPPAGFEDVELETSDGVKLAAWYAPSENGAAIILVHGAGGSRGSMGPLARLLATRGYGVLVLDLRGHGASAGNTNRFGWEGSRDVSAAVGFLKARDPSVRIGGIGSSMGGEVLLGASAASPEIRAIVADGATRRSTDELLALPSERSIVRNFTARVMFVALGLITRDAPPAPLLEEMRRAPATSFLLVAAGDDALEVAFNERFAQVIGDRVSLWVVPGVEHTGARAKYPEEYDGRVIAFLDSHLLP